jgi:hypothetical protein
MNNRNKLICPGIGLLFRAVMLAFVITSHFTAQANGTSYGNTLINYPLTLDAQKDYKGPDVIICSFITRKHSPGYTSISCNTLVDKDSRRIHLGCNRTNEIRFPSISTHSAKAMEKFFRNLLLTDGELVLVNRPLADLHNEPIHAQTVQLNDDPPPNFLFLISGNAGYDPVHTGVERTDLEFVCKTSRDLFFI